MIRMVCIVSASGPAQLEYIWIFYYWRIIMGEQCIPFYRVD